MDGFSLDGIMEMVKGFIPTIAYYLDMATRMFDIFTSYIGLGVLQPETTPEGGEGDEVVQA